ncbi:MAG: alkaline phosphatase D family protein [Chitinophagales bacterium]
MQTISAQNITHGPMIGGVSENSARIYIRTTSAVNFILEYSTDSTFTTFQQISSATDANLDTTKIVDLQNLEVFTDYYFRYRINGNVEGTIGHFKTFPVVGAAEHLTFVTGSCQETPNMKVFNVMPTYNPILFIHTGDFTYPSYQIPRYVGLNYPEDWSAVKLGWRRRNEEPVCKDMLKKMPIAYMPDDDDTWGNSKYFKGGGAQIRYENGKLINYFDLFPRTQQMRTNCLTAYKEFFPGYPMQNDTDGYYHSFKVGNCEFFVIDVRSCNTGGWNNLKYNAAINLWTFDGNNPAQSMLNQPQLDWFLNALKNSTATWKFIISGVPFNKNIQPLVELPLLIQGTQFNIAGNAGTGFRLSYSFSDYFGAYAYERTKILNYIKNNAIKNVIVISGDTHGCAIDDGRNAGLPEMNASGLSVSSTELYYQFNNIFKIIGFDLNKWLWNKGGLGIGNDNMKNAFGKMEVFGNDSVQLQIIDEDNFVVARHTIKNNNIISGVHDLKVMNDLVTIFPNPASEKIQLNLNAKYYGEKIQYIKIFDVNGKEVYSANNLIQQNSSIEIPIQQLSSAAYLITIETDKSFAVQKFVKQ